MITSKELRQAASRTYSSPDKTDDMLRNALCLAADQIDSLTTELSFCRQHNRVPTAPNCHVCGKLLHHESQENICGACRR